MHGETVKIFAMFIPYNMAHMPTANRKLLKIVTHFTFIYIILT